ncbi:Uncharacterised protein [Streptococcus pyogenes]|nr:Uncharacterised protein [Streptococcus pyogenes]VTT22565.1 Uncharacterised protein [Streptococcus dysgalactiae subsp. equisimilis]VGR25742.1 Uncharacterised protein [Streptococcus pyogenes]VGV48735.1 Uncharacterised protein [Streptococcus pyogenes]VGV97656.1 Uncharacterised protein [Streptococcus pyogenes]
MDVFFCLSVHFVVLRSKIVSKRFLSNMKKKYQLV